jgi:hypothetical protein
MIPCLLPNPTTNRPVLLHKTLPKKIKTKHTDAQSSFLVTLSIKITIKVDHVWEKTHIKTHPENPSFFLDTDPNTQNSDKLHKDHYHHHHHHHQPAAKPNQTNP